MREARREAGRLGHGRADAVEHVVLDGVEGAAVLARHVRALAAVRHPVAPGVVAEVHMEGAAAPWRPGPSRCSVSRLRYTDATSERGRRPPTPDAISSAEMGRSLANSASMTR